MDKSKFLKYHEKVIIEIIRKVFSGYLNKIQKKVYEYEVYPDKIKTNMIIYRKGTFHNEEEFIYKGIEYSADCEKKKVLSKKTGHKCVCVTSTNFILDSGYSYFTTI